MNVRNTVIACVLVTAFAQIGGVACVTAGDIANSFLWHKVVGDQNTLSSQCATATTTCTDGSAAMWCGRGMPYLSNSLAESSPEWLCTIEKRISQGAPNN